MRRRTLARTLATGAGTALLAAGLAVPGSVATANPSDDPARDGGGSGNSTDIQDTGPDYNDGKISPEDRRELRQYSRQRRAQAAEGDPQVGDTQQWLALDDVSGSLYLKNYTLRGVGDNIQVWVASNAAFPEGDCRNDLGLTEITDEQVDSFVSEFDGNIYPTESAAFSTPPDRDGTQALLGSGWEVGADRADDIVTLVDNVRDANYYTPETPDGQTYIAGFFYSIFNEYHDRNIMTIDAYDWLHRTGENPPDDTADPAYQACPPAAGEPRPQLYEGVFAHEYQHLLEYYEDPDEATWVNEGLSDYAQTLVGYVDPSIPPTGENADGHIGCFLGYLEQDFGGPEQSLTRWGDQGGPETLCDYGATFTMMQYLFDHYGGADLLSALHREDANGLDGLSNALATVGQDADVMQIVRDWTATMALDAVVDDGARLRGGDAATYTSDTLSAMINWDNQEAYTEDYPGSSVVAEGYNEGAPTNGSDFVRLRDADGDYLSARQLTSLSFDGADAYDPKTVEWTVDSTPPADADEATCGGEGGSRADAAFYSGCGSNYDRSIAQSVTVPTADPTLTFDTLYETEAGWDFGFVQVSTDDGKTWTSLGNENTTSETDPGAIPAVQASVPGFSGSSGGWTTETVDLSDYAGQDVLIGFRYVTDSGVDLPGWWVDDVAVGGTSLTDGSSLADWQTYTQISPIPVERWTVQLVAYDEGRGNGQGKAKGGSAYLAQVPLGADFSGSLSGKAIKKAIGKKARVVAALVMAEDSSETVDVYPTYSLEVNDVLQPGGGGGATS